MFKTLNAFLDKRIRKRAGQLHDMTENIRGCLTPQLAKNCWISDFENGSVTVTTTHAGYATDLHFQQREILKQLNSEPGRKRLRFKKLRVVVSVPVLYK